MKNRGFTIQMTILVVMLAVGFTILPGLVKMSHGDVNLPELLRASEVSKTIHYSENLKADFNSAKSELEMRLYGCRTLAFFVLEVDSNEFILVANCLKWR